MKTTSMKKQAKAAAVPAAARESESGRDMSRSLASQCRMADMIERSPKMVAQGRQIARLAASNVSGNGNAPALQRQVIQLDAVEDLSEAVNNAFSERNKYPAMQGTGSTRWQQDADFIIGGAKGTFHHIVNKERLRTLVKGYIWLNDNLKKKLDPDDYDADELGDARGAMTDAETAIGDFFSKVGDPNGASIRSFYWRKDNGFIGVRADYRLDNPAGTDNESKKPTTMPSGAWDNSLDWYTKLGELSTVSSGINTSKNTVKAILVDLKAKLDAAGAATDAVGKDGTPHRTDDLGEDTNRDWKKTEGTDKAWGSANKIYELK